MKIKIKNKKQNLLEEQIYHILKEGLVLTENVSEKIKRARDIINSGMDTLVSKESIKLLKSFHEYSEVAKDYILNAMVNVYDNSNFNDQIRMAKSHDFLHDHLEREGINLKRFEGKKFGRMSGNYSDIDFIDCDFTEANVTGADFSGSHFEGGNLRGITGHDKANFDEATMRGVELDGNFTFEKSRNFDWSTAPETEEDIKHREKQGKEREDNNSWRDAYKKFTTQREKKSEDDQPP